MQWKSGIYHITRGMTTALPHGIGQTKRFVQGHDNILIKSLDFTHQGWA